MKKIVRATLFKEIITEVDCELFESNFTNDSWWKVIDSKALFDLLRDNGEEFDLDYEVIR